MDKFISIIIPFVTNDENRDIKLPNNPITDSAAIVHNTITLIKNINKKLKFNKEIILVDNSNSFPNIKMDNLKIVKGWQYLSEDEIKKQPTFNRYNIDDFNNLSMWVSMAYNVGIEHATGDYIICQHNDIFYHNDSVSDMVIQMNNESLEYISADYKKIFLSAYVSNKDVLNNYLFDYVISPEDGGYIKTKKLGFADCYFFLCKKEFFNDYYVDWGYGDTNHGATIKCLENKKSFLHLEPFHDNPNFETNTTSRDYFYKDELFITHLKGGFSEDKFVYDKNIFKHDVNEFKTRLEINSK
jgi:glycosyltransferase involved in cell wall biosynthesis|tara:strand:- start:544 stop:1440 length:897 start_codon:yes stop_codon:yes gene_type:complete